MTGASGQVFKRGQRGLFQGARIRFGNKISFSDKKSRRTWKPNMQVKHYYSEALQETIRFRVTTRAARTIDKYGSLDAYLTGMRPRNLDSDLALHFRAKILEARAAQASEGAL